MLKVVGSTPCPSCEGSKVVSRLRTPLMEEFVLPCHPEKLQDRFNEVMEFLSHDPRHATLRHNINVMFVNSPYGGIPCPDCQATPGCEYRLMQTGAPIRGILAPAG